MMGWRGKRRSAPRGTGDRPLAIAPELGIRPVALSHDRVLFAAAPGRVFTVDGELARPGATLAGVNVVPDPALREGASAWASYDFGARTGRDLLPALTLSDGHTGFLRLEAARRRAAEEAVAKLVVPPFGDALPLLGATRLRWGGLFAAQKATATVRLELRDAAGERLSSSEQGVPPAATGGVNPLAYARCGATVDVPEGAASVSLRIELTPTADAHVCVALFTDVSLGRVSDPAEPLVPCLSPFGALAGELAAGTLGLFAAPLEPVPSGTAPRPLVLRVDGRDHVIAHRCAPADGEGAAIALEGGTLKVAPAATGAFAVLADGTWCADVVGSKAIAHLTHELAAPSRILDGRPHTVELVSPAGRHARTLVAAAPHGTDWPHVTRSVAAALPGADAPLAAHRYRALETWARRAADGEVDEWTARHLGPLHDALVRSAPSAAPFPLHFATREAPAASVVMPVHNAGGLAFIALAALAFAPVRDPFEVIVVDDGSDACTRDALAAHEGLRLIRHERAGGFIAAANAGAAAARAPIVVHLNSDTEVTEGWLDPLVDALRRPGVGIAGPKVIYPDGTLQDAGGHVSPNLDPVMVGRGGNAFDPRYGYTREVDYISGAALAVRAELWRELGGFDPRYAPAYFEDVDLAFRAREAGFRALYVPRSVVVHSEGGSHGVDESAGVKRHQRINAPVFKRAFAHRRPPPVPLERAFDRGASAHVLVALAEVPRPDVDAGSRAALSEIAMIRALGAKVTVATRDMAYLPTYAPLLSEMGAEFVHAPFAGSIAAVIAACGAHLDAVYATKFQVLEECLPAIRTHAAGAKVILNLADLHFLREMRSAANEASAARAARAARQDAAETVRARELAAIAAADVVCTYSDVEASVLLSHHGAGLKVSKIPFVQRVGPPPAPRAGRSGLMFLGNYRHPPNGEAVRWFCERVAPELGAHGGFHVYGAYADELGPLEGAHVEGHVADLAGAFSRHAVFVVPLQSGAGVKGKVFEALAAGLPVVATSIAAEGIDLADGEHALIADGAGAFAAAVRRVLCDEALWHRLSANGQRLIATRYGFEAGARAMQAAFEAAGLFLPLHLDEAGAFGASASERGAGDPLHER